MNHFLCKDNQSLVGAGSPRGLNINVLNTELTDDTKPARETQRKTLPDDKSRAGFKSFANHFGNALHIQIGERTRPYGCGVMLLATGKHTC
jgi:hypothetical protein